jgi:hypothetical protein
LAVKRDAAVHIQTEGKRAPNWNRCFHAEQWCTSVLVHVKKKKLDCAWQQPLSQPNQEPDAGATPANRLGSKDVDIHAR